MDISKLSFKQLRAIASSWCLAIPRNAKRDDLLALLRREGIDELSPCATCAQRTAFQ